VTIAATRKVRPNTRRKTAWPGATAPMAPSRVHRRSKALSRKNEVNRFVPSRIAVQLCASPRRGAALIIASLLVAWSWLASRAARRTWLRAPGRRVLRLLANSKTAPATCACLRSAASARNTDSFGTPAPLSERSASAARGSALAIVGS
jgi:hypothetical protein